MSALEVARLLNVSRRTLETLIKNQEAPPHLLVGSQRRWRAQDVDRWARSRIAHFEGAESDNRVTESHG